MRYYLISDSREALDGMRLSGVSGELCADAGSAGAAISRVCADETVAVLLVTTGIAAMIPETVDRLKLSGHRPLLTVIPSPGGNGQKTDTITGLIRDAIGVNI